MKFFTPEACRYSEDPFDRKIWESYRRHIESLRGRLPDRVLKLADLEGTEDGLVTSVDFDRDRRVLKLVMRCGNLVIGYYNLVLVDDEVDILPLQLASFAEIVRDTTDQKSHGFELVNHEIDSAEDGRIEHRLIYENFSAKHGTPEEFLCLEITCSRLSWRKERRRSRRISPARFKA